MGKLYKYVGPGSVAKVFAEPGECRFKCSYPKDFNDPYELFLTVDFNQEPDVLAYYQEVIGTIPQLPTTCFSVAPDVTPMWAHYAQNLEGIAIEVDEERLQAAFPAYNFGDVDYRDQADDDLNTLLGHAYMTCKARHTEWLQTGVFSAAYYTKRTCWGYEQERRLVAEEGVIDVAGVMLVPVPYDCITALIVGSRASNETAQRAAELAGEIGCRCFEMHIGRSTSQPYFVDTDGCAHVYVGGEISACEFSCDECGEPVQDNRDECPWCAVRQDHSLEAAQRNPMRILARYGMLRDYYESAQRIRRGARRGE